MQVKTQQKIINKNQGRVFIDPRPRKISEMLDKDGNTIDPRTKQIIRKATN